MTPLTWGARQRVVSVLLSATALGISAATAQAGGSVNLYSYREPALIEPLLKGFEKETGITVNVVFAKDGLIERAKAEGTNSPADVLLTNESGLLLQAVDAGIAAKVTSPALEAAIPANLRDPAGQWFGLTSRARVIYASKERVRQDAITYEELADPKWKGKICIRSGQHTYNVALVASMIAHHGEADTEKWLSGLRDNLARPPSGGDRDQIKAISAGTCDLALGNTYYMGLMLTNDAQPEQKTWAAAVKLLFPNTSDRGTHVNISGGLVLAHAPNRDNGIKLLEYLVSKPAQEQYASANYEYPVRVDVEASALVKGFGTLKADALPLEQIAKFRKRASELIDKSGLDDGPRG
jgi:iron(III) transport system substrate-binding protein